LYIHWRTASRANNLDGVATNVAFAVDTPVRLPYRAAAVSATLPGGLVALFRSMEIYPNPDDWR
jgi:hypothetical protein